MQKWNRFATSRLPQKNWSSKVMLGWKVVKEINPYCIAALLNNMKSDKFTLRNGGFVIELWTWVRKGTTTTIKFCSRVPPHAMCGDHYLKCAVTTTTTHISFCSPLWILKWVHTCLLLIRKHPQSPMCGFHIMPWHDLYSGICSDFFIKLMTFSKFTVHVVGMYVVV